MSYQKQQGIYFLGRVLSEYRCLLEYLSLEVFLKEYAIGMASLLYSSSKLA